jgi:hypothetical protein
MKTEPASLLPIDVGFDLRVTKHLVRLSYLPQRYMGRDGEPHVTSPDPESAAEQLVRAGYSVVAFLTSNGRDVQCTPKADAPVGTSADIDPDATPGYTWQGNVWAVQKRNDNYWCVGPSLTSAITRAGWTLGDVRPLRPQAAAADPGSLIPAHGWWLRRKTYAQASISHGGSRRFESRAAQFLVSRW